MLVQNARLHERAQELSSEREDGARLGARGGEAAQRALRDLALVRAEPVARHDARRARRVDRDAARRRRGRDPDARRARGRAGRAGGARERRARRRRCARAALAAAAAAAAGAARAARAQRAARCSTRDRAEALGGALALLAPFLRKGSSAAVVPIATPAELLATLTIVSLHPGRPVEGEIAETALSIAGQAALAIDNARLYGQQKAFADTMQRSLLPRAAPELPGLELGDVYESAARVEVGGDVYDYLTLGDGRLAVVLGDVTGHGVDATADMAMAKYVFRSLAREHVDPGEFLAAANEVVSSEIAPGRFITMVELVIDAARGEVACASGGHPPPRLVQPDGTVEGIHARGLALGIDAPQAYETVTADFAPGAIVVAYTDGVVEARRDGEQYGVERLDALLGERRSLPPREIAEAALAACRDWTEGELTDDFAVVVIKRPAVRNSRPLSRRSSSAPAPARSRPRSQPRGCSRPTSAPRRSSGRT